MNLLKLWSYPLLIIFLFLIENNQGEAQIVPDSTLGRERSISTPNQIIKGIPSTRLTGGASRGSNLFHSFSDFNVKSGQGAYFDSPNNIKNILTRVTGNNISQINGILGSLSRADLFFLNSNGIIFGQNASLDLNGSFIGSTANTLQFQDGSLLPINTSQKPTFFSSSQPIRLEFTETSGTIQVDGFGSKLADVTFLPLINPLDSPLGIALQPNNTLALIGGKIQIQAGVIRASSGRIELGSISDGSVDFSKRPSGWTFDYSSVKSFQDIQLSQRALVDTSGIVGGPIVLHGRNIFLDDGSTILIQNFGDQLSGDLEVYASNKVTLNNIAKEGRFASPILAEIIDSEQNARIASTFLTETVGQSRAGNIKITAKNLIVLDGGQILSRTHGSGDAGNVNINTSESTQVLNSSPELPIFFSNISTASFSPGNSGSLTIATDQLIATNGGAIASATFNVGKGGDVTVTANDIFLRGTVPFLFNPSSISASTFGSGNAGTIFINTSSLSLLDGGGVGSSTLASGDAGSVTIDASQFIKVSGSVPGSLNPSLINSSAIILDPALRDQLRVPLIPSGMAGDVTIRTKNLLVNNGGLISVRNDGPNDAGQVNIIANSIILENSGAISARTNGGDGGNVILNASFVLLKDALLSASALKLGRGGNISANADLFVALGESSLTAEAEQGQGGDISIAGKAVFLGPDVDVSVSSDAGLKASGTFRVVVEEQDFNETSAPAPDMNRVPKITSACNPSGKASEFVVLGSGGLQKDPQSQLSGVLSWKVESSDIATTSSKVELLPQASFVEAKGWRRLEDGKVKLTATPQDSSSKVAAHPTPCTQPLKKANS
ncbi:two-partner secretion domain-containing protein, partial [Acaryochloris marina NIES-2412]|uniref:two-partner secretion domain-containing protein n=1 Tax=Acaryochloris marina TaxID=155978 RepID=UPI004058CD9A